jgi:4-hydroxybenzoate polyprenyltransferase
MATKEAGMATARANTNTHPARTAAMVVAVVFLLVGIAGFIPGVTTDYDGMTFAGHESTAMLLGVFHVSILHNIVHLLFGIVGLLMARTASGAVTYLIGGGVVYAVLWLYGLIIDQQSSANFVPLNNADNWLHLVLAIGMIGLGVALRRTTTARAADTRTV